jgi:hypothetical protein
MKMRIFERLGADIAWAAGALRILRMTVPIAKNPSRIFPHVLSELAARYPDAPALLSARESFTYGRAVVGWAKARRSNVSARKNRARRAHACAIPTADRVGKIAQP